MLRYAYNTNGCAHHRLRDAVDLIADSGYDGVALTLDWQHLDPLADDWQTQTALLREHLDDLGLAVMIETGARYLLDPRQKHEPTLLNRSAAGRARRVAFLKRALDIQVMLGGETVSCWSGIRRDPVDEATAWQYLRDGLAEVSDYAHEIGGQLSFEPEPGMHVETNADFERLVTSLDARGEHLRLALDLGHVWVTGETFTDVTETDIAPAAAVYAFAKTLGTVAIEGMDRGVHLHLPLREGTMPIAPCLRALRDVGYDKLVTVELSRESPRAHAAIPESIAFLKEAEATLTPS